MRVKGFTLIELMATIAIAAILIAMAVPSFNDFFEKQRAKGAADGFVSFMADVRNEAVKRDRDVRVGLGGTVSAWCIGAVEAADPANNGDPVPALANCDCAAASCAISGREFEFNSTEFDGVTLSTAAGTVDIDSKLGTTSALAGFNFDVNSKTNKYQIRVRLSPLGQASACIPSGKPIIGGYKSC